MDSERYQCLVVDDEPIARKIIINYIEQMPVLQAATECINAFTAIEYLRNNDDVDIIFLDINMPNLSGIQLMKILRPKQPVILTTAYSEFAVESYELSAADYLLKPFSFDRFTIAVYKAIDILNRGGKKQLAEPGRPQTMYIKSDGLNYPVDPDAILYCEAMKNYTRVVLNSDKKLMPLVPLSKFEKLLNEAGADFIQTHRSFLVNKKHITAIGANSVTINKFTVPLGVQFKERFFKEVGMG